MNDDWSDEDGDEHLELTPNTSPQNASDYNFDDDQSNMKMMESDPSCSSLSDSSFSDVDFDNLSDSLTRDSKSSDDDSILNSTSDNEFKEATGLDDDYLSSLSDNESDVEYNIEESIHDPQLSIANFENADQFIDQKCAVLLCSKSVRNQFYGLCFINFPKNNKALCDKWWKMCGRSDEFDPSLKICSIHFSDHNFKTATLIQDGKLYQKTTLKNNNFIPNLYLLPHEYAIFSTSQKIKKSIITNSTQGKEKSTEIVRCAVHSCQKSCFTGDRKTPFFRFPLENEYLVKQWVNNILMPNWQPSEIDRICSDHFENYYISIINNTYELNKYAIPSIKPKYPFVFDFEDKCDKNSKKAIKFENIEDSSNNLKENSLISREKRKCNNEECILLNSLENNTEYQQLKKNKKTLVTSITQSNSIEKNRIKEEYNQMESALKVNKNKSKDDSNTTVNNISLKMCDANLINKSQMESIEQSTTDEEILIPKSINNGNDNDYVYLDTLKGDNVEKFLSFEKKCILMNTKKKLELLKENHTKIIPESILNQDLIKCFGEMLPPNCNSSCLLRCFHFIPGPQRKAIYNEFISYNVTEQNCTIVKLVKLRMVKKADDTFESHPLYHLLMNTELVKVCRTFFLNTLGIPEFRLNTILKPINYSWYSDRDTALKANLPKQVKIVSEPLFITDFMNESLIALNKDYNLYDPESDTEVSLEDVPIEEYEKVITFLKSVPRVLSSYQYPEEARKQCFETSICTEYMYKMYSENFIKNSTPPPYTKRQFKKIYNRYMKTFLKEV